jgi:O-antigen ligase
MAMNRSRAYLHNSYIDYHRSIFAPRSMDAPVLSLLTWLSLLGYLISLAVTQTVYGRPLMTARWLMLGATTAFGTLDWILLEARKGHRAISNSGHILILYLLLTLSSVIFAENYIFSGMRWVSHAAMLIVLIILIPQIITPTQIRQLLSVLKYIMACLVVLSWINPVTNQYDRLYRGVMGNANTMGHIAAISSLLFLQDFFVTKTKHRRYPIGVFALASMVTVWHSGARSSMIAMMLGILLLFYYYRREAHGAALIGMLAASLAMVTLPKLPQALSQFASKTDKTTVTISLKSLESRVPTWSAAWEGFKDRPLLGWGFGADSSTTKNWEIQLTALGMVQRDPVNDFCFIMEGCGSVGFFAYLMLIYIVLKQCPTKFQRSLLQTYGPDSDPKAMAFHHAHVALYILPVCLLTLNQLDNSALSAGNLISVTLWLSAGCAAAFRNEMEQFKRS